MRPLRDHCQVELQAVKRRYEEMEFHGVSAIDVISDEKLIEFFGDIKPTDDTAVTSRLNLSIPPCDCDDSSQSSVSSSSSLTSRLNTGFIASPCRHASVEEHDKYVDVVPLVLFDFFCVFFCALLLKLIASVSSSMRV